MTTPNTPPQDNAAIPKSNAIRRLGRLIAQHKIISTASIGVVIAALAVGSFFTVTAIQHQTAASEYQSSLSAARGSYTANTDAYGKFVAAKSAATDYHGAAQTIVTGSSGYVDAATATAFAQAVTQLGTDLSIKPGATTVSQLDVLRSDATTDQYTRAVRHLDGLAATAKKETAATQKATNTIRSSQQATETALVKVARSIDGTSKTVLAANAKADVATQEAFTAAAKAATEATPTSNAPTPTPTGTAKPTGAATPTPAPRAASTETKPTLLTLVMAYLAKSKALTDAQAAAVAAEKAAADAAAQQAAQEAGQSSYVDSSGNSHSTPPRSGGSSSGGNGGGSSSGGSSSGGGGGAGGGTTGGGGSSGGGSSGGGGVAGGYVTFSGGNYTPGCAAGAQVSSGHFTNDPSPHITTSYSFPWTGSSSVSGSTSYYTIYQCSGGGAGGW